MFPFSRTRAAANKRLLDAINQPTENGRNKLTQKKNNNGAEEMELENKKPRLEEDAKKEPEAERSEEVEEDQQEVENMEVEETSEVKEEEEDKDLDYDSDKEKPEEEKIGHGYRTRTLCKQVGRPIESFVDDFTKYADKQLEFNFPDPIPNRKIPKTAAEKEARRKEIIAQRKEQDKVYTANYHNNMTVDIIRMSDRF